LFTSGKYTLPCHQSYIITHSHHIKPYHKEENMSEKKRTKLSKRLLWIIPLALVIMGGGSYAYYRFVYLPAQGGAGESSSLQTATARRGNLTQIGRAHV
jgi:hypothetical protein